MRLKFGATLQVGEKEGEKMKQSKQKKENLGRDPPGIDKTNQALEEGVQEPSREDEVAEKENTTEEVPEKKRIESTGSAKHDLDLGMWIAGRKGRTA